MLKKINRLSQDTEFKYVKENGRMMRTPLFGLVWTINQNDQLPMTNDLNKKVGFIVSKKISKRAVDRNRIKRLLAEAVRNNLEKLPEGFRGIFLVTRQMLGRKYEEIEREIIKIQIPKSKTQ